MSWNAVLMQCSLCFLHIHKCLPLVDSFHSQAQDPSQSEQKLFSNFHMWLNLQLGLVPIDLVSLYWGCPGSSCSLNPHCICPAGLYLGPLPCSCAVSWVWRLVLDLGPASWGPDTWCKDGRAPSSKLKSQPSDNTFKKQKQDRAFFMCAIAEGI